MPFVLRPYRRFSVVNAVTYEHGWGEGPGGLVWNLSLTGWQLSGNLPLVCLAAVFFLLLPAGVFAGSDKTAALEGFRSNYLDEGD